MSSNEHFLCYGGVNEGCRERGLKRVSLEKHGGGGGVK